jgi:hypothetical protein
MLGLGTLFRVLKGLLGKPLEDTGVLPTRYYLREILEALDHDNIGEAVRLLRKSKGALIDRSRLDLVRQQIIFRCRVLREQHRKRIHLLEGKIKAHKKRGTFPWQWFRKRPAEKLLHYEKTLALEKQAQDLLEKYESELKTMVKGQHLLHN